MESILPIRAGSRKGFLAGRSFETASRLTGGACWLLPLLFLCEPCGAAAVPVVLQQGRIVTQSPGAEVMLGEPYWFWEGGSSRVTVEQHGNELAILFHLDVANTAYWIDLQIWQTADGVAVVGSHSSGIWPDVCESYASWDELLKHRDQPLAEIAVCCLARCGLNSRFQSGPTATAALTR
ncbi:MAG TPA: hypothetical protein VGI81_19495 [Tepidisphaeraceae bacterium]|jgi:hypothetical protein